MFPIILLFVGGIHLCEARRRFLEGSLHPANVLMCPHTCVTNLPKPRELHHGNCFSSTSSRYAHKLCTVAIGVWDTAKQRGNMYRYIAFWMAIVLSGILILATKLGEMISKNECNWNQQRPIFRRRSFGNHYPDFGNHPDKQFSEARCFVVYIVM